eukprot:1161540-Pelagomonas_calceolata.AAC.30
MLGAGVVVIHCNLLGSRPDGRGRGRGKLLKLWGTIHRLMRLVLAQKAVSDLGGLASEAGKAESTHFITMVAKPGAPGGVAKK